MRITRVGIGLPATFLAISIVSRPASADPMATSPEQAYDLGEIPSARGLAMGGALSALGVSTTALYLNPANMSLARVYHLEALGSFSPEAKRQTYGLAAVDSVLNASHVAGGLAGTWSLIDPDGIHRSWTDVRVGASLPLGDHFSLGTTLRWLRVDQGVGAGPFGKSSASDGTRDGPIFDAVTLDAGATAGIGGFRVAVVGHNLTNPSTALAPTTATAGVGYSTETFAVEADGLLDFTTWGGSRGRFMGGGELFVAERYALRAGWRYDGGTATNAASFGLGYIDPRWSIEIALRRDVGGDRGATLGVLSLRYFYDPMAGSTPADNPDSM